MALLLAAVILASGPSKLIAAELSAGPADCGGDAFSTAQVIENRPPRRGPIVAMPQTLCADLAPQGPGIPLEIGVYPMLGPRHGAMPPAAPYR